MGTPATLGRSIAALTLRTREGWQARAREVMRVAACPLGRVTARLGAPASPLEWYRWILLAVTLVNVVLLGPVLLSEDAVAWPIRLAATVTLGALSWWWLRQYRGGTFPVLGTLAEAAGLWVVGVGVGDPLAALGLLYLALYYRSLYGSARRVALGAGAYLAAHYAAALAAVEPTSAFSLSQVLLQVTGIPIGAGVLFMMAQTLRKHERAVARERILTQVGTAVAAATSEAAIFELVLRALGQLMTTFHPLSQVALVIPDCATLLVPDANAEAPAARHPLADAECRRLRAHADNPLAGITEAAPELGFGPSGQFFRAESVQVCGGARAVVLAAAPEPFAHELGESLRSLAVLAGLALERVAQADEVRRSEARFRSLVQNAPDLISVLSATGVILMETPATRRALGYAPEARLGASAMEFIHPEDLPLARAALGRLVARPKSTERLELRARHADGRWLWFEVHARNELDNPDVQAVVVNWREITDQKRAAAELLHQARHDTLTDLPNRLYLRERLDQALREAAERGQALALLLLDLDGFKDINDTLGHAAGDMLLQEIGPRLTRVLGERDTLARLGGDEFAVVLPGQAAQQARATAANVLHTVQRPFSVGGASLSVSVSVGIAVFPEHGADGESLLRRADVAMYLAKRGGTGVAVYDPASDEYSPMRLALVGELRRAIEVGGLAIHFQPKVNLASGAVVGAEALVRWPHPERGLIPPDVFVPMAARAGLIKPLTDWVFEAAVQQRQRWLASGQDVCVAVNFSTHDLLDPDLVGRVEAILRKHAASADGLILEITEDSLVRETGEVLTNAARLREMGFRVSIDDFGTGYSSLARLVRLPVDELKIDRSFVRQVRDEREQAVVRSIIDLGRHLQLRVVAEGIEDAATWHLLRSLGCHEGQGYFFGRPGPAEALPPRGSGAWAAGPGRDVGARAA